MKNNFDKTRIAELINKTKTKGKIKTYSEFCETKQANKTALSEEEIIYYTSRNKGENK